MNDFILDLTLVKDTINLLPKWIQINPEIIGIEILEEEKEEFYFQNNMIKLMPYIFYLIMSNYVAKMIYEWHENDEIVAEDIR
jgi:hypothetical protein